MEFDYMKLLVIGASGFIGGSLYKKALGEGLRAVGTKYLKNGDGLIHFNMLEHEIKDRLPKEFLDEPEDVLAVICSANPLIEECRKHPQESYELNVVSMKRLFKSLSDLKIRFCFLSTDNVFDGAAGYYDESEPTCPCNEYGRQKAEIEKFILENYSSELIFRLSQTVSDSLEGRNLFNQWNNWCVTKKEILCIKDNFFAPTFVGDIYTAAVLAFSRKASGLYNCVNGEHFSREELARQFVRHIFPGIEIKITVKPVEEFGFSDKHALRTYLDNTKIVNDLKMRFTSMKTVFRSILARK